jgi:hypothetical protein
VLRNAHPVDVEKEQTMNWTWAIRTRDGGMNGLEFTKATTAGVFTRVLVHAAPALLSLNVVDDNDHVVARGHADRQGDYSPMTQLELAGGSVLRSEIWPTGEHLGMLVLIAGGETGVLQRWEHADDHSWWRWTVEFSNHVGRPADWAPPGQQPRR